MDDLDRRIAELSEALRSPDPVTRDEQAYPALLRLIPDLAPAQRRSLGDAMAERFTDPWIQARTFAPLILAALVKAGTYAAHWLEAFARWYPTETDLRGHDAKLGWLHAVAHGADLLGAFGRHSPAEPAPLLALGSARMLAPSDRLWDAMEDERLGVALARTLTRPELTVAQSVGWLDAVAADFTAGEPGPVPYHASNCMRTLWMLYLCADRGVRLGRGEDGVPVPLTHRDAVRERLAQVLAIVSPALG